MSPHTTSRGVVPTVAAAMMLVVAGLAGCGASDPETVATTAARTPEEVVAQPLDGDELARCLRVLTGVPAEQRPAFSPAVDDITTAGLDSAALIAAHRRRYAEALEPRPHAAVWRQQRTLSVALRREQLSAERLAELLTAVSCAHQSAQLLDLNELRSDTEVMLNRLASQWDAGEAANPRPLLERAIAELVALDSYLALLAAVPPENVRLTHQHWAELEAVLPKPQLREQLTRIEEYRFDVQQTAGQQPHAPQR